MTYEFYCKKCKTTFEHECKMKDKPKELRCPSCDGIAEPAMSLVGSHFPQGRCKGGYHVPECGGRAVKKFY
jgi:putative FmdB family regulatory protein